LNKYEGGRKEMAESTGVTSEKKQKSKKRKKTKKKIAELIKTIRRGI
jgi:Txe/YoeB family toxin of Txe-Axe toxin-antitoxin module